MRGGVPIARIAGIEIRVHLSWVLILGLLTVSMGGGLLPAVQPHWPAALDWGLAGVGAVLFLVSIAIHELAHAIVAGRYGNRMSRIILYFFGGTASMEAYATNPHDELRIAAAGPISSFALSLVFTALAVIVEAPPLPGADGISAVAWLIAGFNLTIAVLNLLPGFPLDGGRMARALIWRRTGDVRQATRIAARLGRGLGTLFIGLGFLSLLFDSGFDGLIVILGGWVLRGAAAVMLRQADLATLVQGVHVEDAMDREPPSVGPHLTLDTFAEQSLAAGPGTSLAVLDDGRFLGLIGVDQLRQIGRQAWKTMRAADVMARPPDLPELSPDAELWPAVELLQRSGFDGLPVTRQSEFLGVLTRKGAVAAIQARLSRMNTAGGQARP